MKPDANMTTLITLTKDNESDVLIVNNAPIEVIHYQDSVKVKMYTHIDNPDYLGKVFDSIIIDCTNDPTPVIGGGVTSLGYHLIRVGNRKAKIVKINPFTFVGGANNFIAHMVRPQRTIGSDLNGE